MPADLTTSLADAVHAARLANGLSTSALAGRSGVSRAMIAKIERAEAQPTAALLGRLSGALGITLSELIARAEHSDRRLVAPPPTPPPAPAVTSWRSRGATADAPHGHGRLTPHAVAEETGPCPSAAVTSSPAPAPASQPS